jgi:hypothetical protein
LSLQQDKSLDFRSDRDKNVGYVGEAGSKPNWH